MVYYTPSVHLKYQTSPPKTSPVVSAILGRLNHHVIDNCDVEVYPSEYPFESTSEYVLHTETTLIKLIDDGKINQVLELFHSYNDDDLLDVDIQTLKY